MSLKEEIADKSSRYYELIPVHGYKTDVLPPIDNGSYIEAQLKNIQSLLNLVIPVKVLLGKIKNILYNACPSQGYRIKIISMPKVDFFKNKYLLNRFLPLQCQNSKEEF